MAVTLRTVLPAVLVLGVAGVIAWTERDLADGAPSTEPPHPAGVTAPPAPDAWHAQPVQRLTVPRFEPFSFTVEGPEPQRLTATVQAPVGEILVTEDQAVAAGDLLVRLTDRSWVRALEQAREAGDAAAIETAAAALEAVRQGLELRAPVDGIVLSVGARLGDVPLITPRGPQALVTLFDWRRMRFTATVPAEPVFFARGAGVVVRMEDGAPTRAAVTAVGEPDAEGRRAVVLTPVEPPTIAPDPGTKAEVLVAAGDREVLVIPRAAVVEQDGRPTVRVVQVTGDLRDRIVTLGEFVPGDRVEVIGLTPFESVAVPEAR